MVKNLQRSNQLHVSPELDMGKYLFTETLTEAGKDGMTVLDSHTIEKFRN